jgi:hypothetical protein
VSRNATRRTSEKTKGTHVQFATFFPHPFPLYSATLSLWMAINRFHRMQALPTLTISWRGLWKSQRLVSSSCKVKKVRSKGRGKSRSCPSSANTMSGRLAHHYKWNQHLPSELDLAWSSGVQVSMLLLLAFVQHGLIQRLRFPSFLVAQQTTYASLDRHGRKDKRHLYYREKSDVCYRHR